MALENVQRSIATLGKRHRRALTEMHPELLARVSGLLSDLKGQFMIWQGFRDKNGQQTALAMGRSRARWGQSPHNYRPCLAVDVVLNPARVVCEPHPEDDSYPNLWQSGHPAWAELERAAIRHHRSGVGVNGKRDLPHLELPGWWDMVQRDGLEPG